MSALRRTSAVSKTGSGAFFFSAMSVHRRRRAFWICALATLLITLSSVSLLKPRSVLLDEHHHPEKWRLGLNLSSQTPLIEALNNLANGAEELTSFLHGETRGARSVDKRADSVPGGNFKSQCPSNPKSPRRRLKVYVYDLPRKFNFGLFSRRPANGSIPSTVEDLSLSVDDIPWGQLQGERGAAPPAWPWSGRSHPTAKQHSMEYYIAADLLLPPHMRHAETTAVRVTEPEEADVFFVPVFGSLFVNVYRRRRWDVYARLADELADFLAASPWWRRSAGRDHVVPVHHPCALETVRDWLSGAIFVTVDFARFHPATANPNKDIVHPYNQLVLPFPREEEERAAAAKGGRPFDARPTLLFFQGSASGRPARRRILEALQGDPDVHVADVKATPDTIKEAQAGMRSSKFCLHVVGDTPSASRLFSAIVSGCVPVIVSDAVDLPFESSINYAHLALFFREKVALEKGHVVDKLRSVGEEEWTRMWEELRRVQHHFLFQVPSLPEDAVDMMWREVRQKLPSVRLSINRDKRLTVPDWWDQETKMDDVLRRRSSQRRNRAGLIPVAGALVKDSAKKKRV